MGTSERSPDLDRLEAGIWTLWRDDPDPFPQRFRTELSDVGPTISGRWEKALDGTNWQTDFDLTYRRIDSG